MKINDNDPLTGSSILCMGLELEGQFHLSRLLFQYCGAFGGGFEIFSSSICPSVDLGPLAL